MKFNEAQRLVANTYEDGAYADITVTDDAKDLGDGLFTFLIDEAGDAGDLEDLDLMIDIAIRQLQDLSLAISKRLCT